MALPQLENKGSGYCFTWEEYKLRFHISRIRKHSDKTNCQLLVETTNEAYNPYILQMNFNLSSLKARQDLKRELTKRYKEKVDWDEVLEQLCFNTLALFEEGEPVQVVSTTDLVGLTEYQLYPLIPLDMPTIWFGDGGSFKSYLGLLAAICVQLPWYDNPLGLKPRRDPVSALYLDYETDREAISHRMSRLSRGMNIPFVSIHYRRCNVPLADDLEAIQQKLAQTNAKLIIVDSLGIACGGDLREQQVAADFFLKLRQLGVTSLLITHTAKDSLTKTRTPFGSVYFSNLARSVWEVKKQQEAGKREISLGLYHRKANDSELFTPIGLKAVFDNVNDSVTVTLQDLRGVPELASGLPLRAQIREVLRGGKMTVAQIAEELDGKPDSIKTVLNRFKGTDFVKLDDMWGLLQRDEA